MYKTWAKPLPTQGVFGNVCIYVAERHLVGGVSTKSMPNILPGVNQPPRTKSCYASSMILEFIS